MGLKEEFEEYAEKATWAAGEASDENKLIVYGLYKQATVGPVNIDAPAMTNLRERAKWDAWKAVGAKTKDEAMRDYVALVKKLLEEVLANGTA